MNNTITEDSLRIEGRNSIAIPPSYYTIHIDNPYTLPKKIDKTARLPRMFDNIGLWYLIQGIKADMPRDPELKEALTVLTKYMENRRLHEQINAMRRVTMKTEEKVNAINFIQSEITKDSIQSEEEYEGNDLQLLLAAFANDSTFQWLKKISRDSIQLEIIDQNDSLAYAMWINNGMHQYRRLWLKTSSGDSIGTWLETLPEGNRLRINIDGANAARLNEIMKEKSIVKINNTMNPDNFKVADIDKSSLAKRYWTYFTSYDLNLTQAAVKNWASGGQNSLSMILKFVGKANYNKNKFSLENYLKCNLGVVWYQGSSPRKSDDYFEINSKLGYNAGKNWFYTLQFNLQTQLFNSYKYSGDTRTLVANFMSPTYIVPSLGMNYKPNNRVSLLVSPIAGKLTYLRDNVKVPPKNYGVPEDKHVKSSVGMSINYIHSSKTLWNIMNVKSEFESFLYYNMKDYKVPLYANWKLTLKFNINYFINTTLYMETMYNESSSTKVQFKENLGIGVSFRL
ncbi:MAG: DUF3078 domain-containing protein [Marinifilaceae bacterium]|nr:DUF3078 domain-containing protein [Marinifilaceae bacterium]